MNICIQGSLTAIYADHSALAHDHLPTETMIITGVTRVHRIEEFTAHSYYPLIMIPYVSIKIRSHSSVRKYVDEP